MLHPVGHQPDVIRPSPSRTSSRVALLEGFAHFSSPAWRGGESYWAPGTCRSWHKVGRHTVSRPRCHYRRRQRWRPNAGRHLIGRVISAGEFGEKVGECDHGARRITPGPFRPAGRGTGARGQVGYSPLQDFRFQVLRYEISPVEDCVFGASAWRTCRQGNWPPGFQRANARLFDWPGPALRSLRCSQPVYSFRPVRRSALPNGWNTGRVVAA